MDERTASEIARAERAKLILEDPMVVAALHDMREHIRNAWEQSPARDKEGREELFRYMKVIGNFESAFRTHIGTGEIAAHQLKTEEERQSVLARLRDKLPF
ncbi:conserved hypothetical protein [Cupriavidus taiwanensis]|uniref:hypothetical protein n=1 Tax=Cupriavidus taiwanensis TaxID=164546 RepID=UPI000E178B24|nr:hypothetical protein [Cupriavidus taiwanensis]SOY79937.1 conserved hypothetical protein [Cupriavidus taiwanensis]SOY81906.1 conserved hypothetical protein [Cupriavidus taiwanensis]